MAIEANPRAAVTALPLDDDGQFPNNVVLPALVYRHAFQLAGENDPAALLLAHFERNSWSEGWRDGVYDYHHYHSTAHEVLGCYAGQARLQLGGPRGTELSIAAGDVLVIPAGVAHRRIGASQDFAVVGCYADGKSYDMNTGKPGERPQTDENIAALDPPSADPVYGTSGPLMKHWRLV